jgi:hypothetical protein
MRTKNLVTGCQWRIVFLYIGLMFLYLDFSQAGKPPPPTPPPYMDPSCLRFTFLKRGSPDSSDRPVMTGEVNPGGGEKSIQTKTNIPKRNKDDNRRHGYTRILSKLTMRIWLVACIVKNKWYTVLQQLKFNRSTQLSNFCQRSLCGPSFAISSKVQIIIPPPPPQARQGKTPIRIGPRALGKHISFILTMFSLKLSPNKARKWGFL